MLSIYIYSNDIQWLQVAAGLRVPVVSGFETCSS